MPGHKTRPALVLVSLLVGTAVPAMAQLISPEPQPMPFPVLASDQYRIDPHGDSTDRLFRVTARTLLLRSTESGFVDTSAYCRLPERHWGPVSMINCSLEVSGQPPRVGFAVPSSVSLASLPLGSTVTLRLLLQAPLIILDLQGNPSVVLDTFVEEYRWTLAARPLPIAGRTLGRTISAGS